MAKRPRSTNFWALSRAAVALMERNGLAVDDFDVTTRRGIAVAGRVLGLVAANGPDARVLEDVELAVLAQVVNRVMSRGSCTAPARARAFGSLRGRGAVASAPRQR